MIIHPTEKDIPELRRSIIALFNTPFTKSTFKTIFQVSQYCYIQKEENSIVSALLCSLESRHILEIKSFYTLPAYREKGFGSSLLSQLIHDFNNQNLLTSISLHVLKENQEAVSLYKKYGFIIIRTIENYNRRVEHGDAYLMEYKRIKKM
ncbi:hypothetical protein WA158_008002 [Blastocystis sp. Blastoise]